MKILENNLKIFQNFCDWSQITRFKLKILRLKLMQKLHY